MRAVNIPHSLLAGTSFEHVWHRGSFDSAALAALSGGAGSGLSAAGIRYLGGLVCAGKSWKVVCRVGASPLLQSLCRLASLATNFPLVLACLQSLCCVASLAIALLRRLSCNRFVASPHPACNCIFLTSLALQMT